MNKYSLLGAALAALFDISSNAVYAADTGEMDEVVVTATRVEAEASDSPASVTVVNAKNIEAKNVSRLGDALDQVPGLYLRGGAFGQSQGTIGTSGMSLRGVDQAKTLILMDGQPIQDANTGKLNWRLPFVEDIARIEVVPGSFSSLYGSNAIGGVINIITKQPDKREFTAKAKKGWSDASGEEASVYFRDKMENGLGFAGGIGYQNHDSYVNEFIVASTPCAPSPSCPAGTVVSGMQATTTREGAPAYVVGDMGTTPWHSSNATAKLFYDLNANSKIYAGIAHHETDQEYTNFNTYLRNAATGAPFSSGIADINGQRYSINFNTFSFQPLHEAATRYFLGYEGVVGNDYLLKADIAKIERKYNFTLAGTSATWNSGAGSLSDAPNDGLDGTVQLTFPVGARHIWVTGFALHKESANQRIYTLSNWRNPDSKTAVSSGYNGDSTTASVFVQDEFGATDALKIYVGGRWDDWKTQGDYFTSARTVFPSRSVSAFSPKASVIYKPVEAAVLRASIGRSFRAPISQDLYSSTTSRGRTTTGDPNLQPERGTTWEVGGEFRFTEKIKTNVTYFDTQLSNLIYVKQIFPEPPPPALKQSVRINAGKAKIQGVELSATSKLANWLDLDVNYSYIKSEMLENAADPGSVGKRLTDSPQNIAGIGLTARYGPWSGMLNARYVSHVFWTAQNTDVVEGVPGSYDSHTMVNTKFGYEFAKGIKGSVSINNLLDEKAYSYFLLPGRNVTAEMDFSF